MEKIMTHNEAETAAVGFSLGKKLGGGTILALRGELGAGKTKFLQGLAAGLGVKGRVNSPTFNILKLYKIAGNKGVKVFCHIDAYRLRSEKDLVALGVEEFFADSKTVVAIEWAEKVGKILPKKTIMIRIEDKGESAREITIR